MKCPIKIGDKVRVTGYAVDVANTDIGMPVTHRWDAVVVAINEPLVQVQVKSNGDWAGCVVEVYPCQCRRIVKKKKKGWTLGAARTWTAVNTSVSTSDSRSCSSVRYIECVELTPLVRKRLGIE